MERRHQAKILRKTKTDNVLNEKRRSLNVPHLVAVIPLSNNVFVNEKLMEMINVLQKADVKLTTSVASEGYSHLWLLLLFYYIVLFKIYTLSLNSY
jgi:hypothetical protein